MAGGATVFRQRRINYNRRFSVQIREAAHYFLFLKLCVKLIIAMIDNIKEKLNELENLIRLAADRL